MHEFATLPGVVEDVTDIVLNLKKVKFKAHTIASQQMLLLSVNKEGAVTAGDIQVNQDIEVVNPKQHHLHARQEDRSSRRNSKSKSAAASATGDENKKPDQAIGVIADRLDLLAGHARALRGREHPRRPAHRLRQA